MAPVTLRHVLLLLLLSIVPVHAALADGKPADPKTVTDYFLLVPMRYMPYYDLDFRQQVVRGERRGTIIDIPNGFLSWDASDNTEYFEVAIFRKSNGRHVVAYNVPYDDQFPDASVFLLLTYESGEWRDATRELLPITYDRTDTYSLPRRGKSILVGRVNGQSFELKWENDRFVLQKP
jgi:hypothetical protein